MATIKCKMCGGTMEIAENSTVAVCEYCGSQQTIPRLSDERKANLYDRANHFRRNNEFDKAQAIYEQILNEDSNDAESYWSLVLCKYGIEYVEDPSTHRMVPTVNRTQFTSVFEDSNYKEAIRLSDESQRAIYEEEAKAIDDIQRGILEISKNEEPFDVFICYKETDESGKRTRDSVLGQDLYYELKKAGFKVFFSRITLESKLGTAYEPYIFSALNSSKVMVVIGTKAEYFKAVWVRNEWSRFLDMIKRGEKKTLIPAYRDMDPYDLPEEFSFLQAQDMSKLGFMQDLVAGIRKLLGGQKKDSVSSSQDQQKNETQGKKKNPLLARAFIFMEDGEFDKADEYIDKVLDQEPQNAMAYLASVMTEYEIRKTLDKDGITIDDLFDIPEEQLNKFGNYKKALRFADDEFKHEYLDKRVESFARKDEQWKTIRAEYEARIGEAHSIYSVLQIKRELLSTQFARKWSGCSGYSSLMDLVQGKNREIEKVEEYKNNESSYNEACQYMNQKEYLKAAEIFKKLSYFKDSMQKANECKHLEEEKINQQKYDMAKSLIDKKKYDEALGMLNWLGGWKDARQIAEQLHKKKERRSRIIVLVILSVLVLVLVVGVIISLTTWYSDEYGHWHVLFGSQVGLSEHDYQLVESIEPTNNSHGLKKYKCRACGWIITVQASEHEYVDYECVICGKQKYEVGNLGPAGGYIFYDCDADNDSGNQDGLRSSECGWRFLEVAPANVKVLNGVPTVDTSNTEYKNASTGYVFGYYRILSENLFVNDSIKYNEAECTGRAVGTGKKNTELLVKAMGDSAYSYSSGPEKKTSAYAAKLCDDLVFNGFDDWFLPSKDELNLMYVNLKKAGLGGFADGIYWSSSDYDLYTARYQYFGNGYQGNYGDSRSYSNRVRPVRAF